MRKSKLTSALYVAIGCLLINLVLERSYGQGDTHSFSIDISVSEDLKEDFKSEGRLFLFLKEYPGIPRFSLPAGSVFCLFARNITGWDKSDILSISSTNSWDSFQPKSFLLKEDPNTGFTYREPWDIEKIPEGTYYLQVFWDQNTTESKLKASSNLYSEVIEVNIK